MFKSMDTYQQWQEAQKIPCVTGFYIEDINKIEVAPWELKGGLGAFLNLEGTGGINDAYVCVIPPGQKLKPQRHLYEETVYITQGCGATTVWQKSGKKSTFEWQTGSLFAIPLNAHYQHHNGSGSEPVHYFAVTSAPLVINLFHNLDFIFDNDFTFLDRFDPNEDDYFMREGVMLDSRHLIVNFIANVNAYQMNPRKAHDRSTITKHFNIAYQTMGVHIAELSVGSYGRAHRHGPGAHIMILSGAGHTRLWPEGKEKITVYWEPHTVFVPPHRWFHQHFNFGTIPVRFLALRKGGRGCFRDPTSFYEGGEDPRLSTEKGGGRIEYGDEDPEIHRQFEAALARAGIRCSMGK